MAPVCYARDPHLVPLDAVFEFRRGVGNKPNGVKWLRYLEGKGAIDEVYKNILLRVLTIDERPCPREVKIETDDVFEPRRRPVAPESGKRKYSFADPHDDRGKARSSEDNEAKVPLGNDRLDQKRVKEEHETKKNMEPGRHLRLVPRDAMSKLRYARGRVGSKPNGVGWSRFVEDKGAMDEVYNYKNILLSLPRPREVKIDTDEEDLCEPRKSPVASKNRKRKHGQVPLREKAAFGYCAVKKEPDHCVESSSIILDSNKVIKKEIASPFICSKRYHSSMAGEGCPRSADSEFRRELFEVLKKPYDREEYKKSREAIRDGSYLDLYPGLQSKLTKYRYKRDKLMIIVRGFLFWLQNLTREGSFKPWKDKQCLKLELPSR